ncbi:hypothetical protein G5C66_10520 [Nocardioides sp. KC13]|uniref:Pentapeptide repeat-containing protein n=1 Tax=Nocardioides turkmenicus TaxID=2711220 RepID=A0A6M1R6D2_9ACTN|nr:pentapeptide repeat-containing protein [Nocardioides sp. KC13]NGN93168.1 hypothetical protein [Nocardioides sp. KC13]
METFTIRDTRVTLPALDERDLQAASTLETVDDPITYFSYRDQALRLLEIVDSRLHDGLIQEVTTERTHIADVRLSSIEFADCELASLVIVDSRLTRVKFKNCRLLGARFSEVTMEDVVFERCRLDYATFTHVVAKGAVAFVGCSLTEAEFDGSDLSRAAFTENRLAQTAFGPGTYRDTDLRENDLSAISGVVNLRQALLDRHQLADLTGALAHDLDLTFADDLE